MRHIAVFALSAVILAPANASAEAYRCIMDRQITVGGNDMFEDNKEANRGTEFYLSIDNKTQRGTFSTCNQGGCGNVGEIPVVTRYETEGIQKGTKNLMIRMITGPPGQLGRLWNLERRGGDRDFTAIAISAIGQRSDTELGTCQMIIE
jgi:hypothetical protein